MVTTILQHGDSEALVRGCIEGDRRAQHALFVRYRGTILRLVWHLLGPQRKEDAEDAVQQAFVALFRSLPRFRWDASLETWVYRITRNVCMSRMRRRYRKGPLNMRVSAETLNGELADSGPGPAQQMQRKQSAARLYRALDRLPASWRTVFVLAEIEGRGLREVAAIVNRPVGTVKSRLFRARRKLAAILRPCLED
jgi:RNA polymerase sigma-70 factor (ECF subfamily)